VADNPRIQELRRRVESDPASIAFAQLAEEFRRAGDYEEAARVCRAGLARHPSYLSARVTLGRSLLELHRYDEAQTALECVLRSAPENLAAIRGLAEIHLRRGELADALRQYQIALSLAKHDPELEESVLDLNRRLGADAARGAEPHAALDIEDEPQPVRSGAPAAVADAPAIPSLSLSPALEAAADEFTKALQALDALALDLPGQPSVSPQPVVADAGEAEPAPAGEQAMVNELESWLDSIVRDREARASGR
jgi:tetratricopeptide (TPR) repeat protein